MTFGLDDNAFGFYEGECQGCDIFTRVDDVGLFGAYDSAEVSVCDEVADGVDCAAELVDDDYFRAGLSGVVEEVAFWSEAWACDERDVPAGPSHESGDGEECVLLRAAANEPRYYVHHLHGVILT